MPIDRIKAVAHEFSVTDENGRIYPIASGTIAVQIGNRTIVAEVFEQSDAATESLLSGEVWYRPSVSAGKTRKLP